MHSLGRDAFSSVNRGHPYCSSSGMYIDNIQVGSVSWLTVVRWDKCVVCVSGLNGV